MSRQAPPSSTIRRTLRLLAACVMPIGFASAAVVTLSSAYLGVLTGAAAVDHRRSRRTRPSVAPGDADAVTAPTTFAVMIPAHDEASVIEATVRALVRQRYPDAHFDVYVVADNCTDATASVAAAAGAIVHERAAPGDPGKGAALNWLFGEVGLGAGGAVVVVDADTVAEPGFLAGLHRAFASGATVVQGDYGVLDPERSAAVGLRYAALACRHRLRPLGRRALGCSCGLYGNGMAFRNEVFADRSWSGHLVEDAEFQLELLLDGVTVAYAPDAMIAAEMPETLDASLTQHRRWELGRSQLIKRYVPPLIRRFARPIPGSKRRIYVDAVLDLLLPPLSVVAATTIASVAMNVGTHAVAPRRSTAVASALSGAGAVALVVHVVAGLRSADAPPSVWRSLGSAPRLVLWKLALLAGVARRPDDVTWTRTERNDDPGAVVAAGGGMR